MGLGDLGQDRLAKIWHKREPNFCKCLGDMERAIELSKRFASELKLKHECRGGTLCILKDGIMKTKELARSGKLTQ